jgi:hypothetical protein
MNLRRYGAAFAVSAALHIVLAVSAFWPTRTTTQALNSTITVFPVAPADDPQFPGLHPLSDAEKQPSGAHEGLKMLALPRVRIDLETIAARQHLLFPVLTPGLAIDSFCPNPASVTFALRANLSWSDAAAAEHGPLVLDDRAVQSIVDRSWARRGRWRAFQNIAQMLTTHAPGGSLPRVLRAYREQNALQPYADRDSRDPRLWTQLALAADHVSFVGFIRTYTASRPSARETTELLLLLDTIVQAEQDALHVLLDTDPAAELDLTRTSNPDAYALLVEIRQEYRGILNNRGLVSKKQIDAYYDTVRLTILQRVIDTSGDEYGANDARFLSGAILWAAGRRPEALKMWRRLTAGPTGSYAASGAALRLALSRPRVDDLEIERVLRNENGRWVSLSYERLRHFGYRFDTY